MMDSGGAGTGVERELNAYERGGRGTPGDDRKDEGDEGEGSGRDLDGRLRETAQGIENDKCRERSWIGNLVDVQQ